MSLRLEIKKKMMERSPRVKSIDFHNQNSWVAFGLYSGTIALHDYSNNTCIRTIEASTFPIRTVKFLCKKHWILTGSDDFHIRIFNYNTMEKVKAIEAHNDFIRAIIVHPNEPFIISASDDSKIKIWNYQKNFVLERTLEEHKHFVLTLAFNPKDLSKFASGSMDKTIKLWNLTTDGKANLTISGHKGSVNAIDFYKGDRPHFATGSDDKTIKIWDYQTRQCLSTIETHTMAVTSVNFHPDLPIIFSTGQDGKSIIHHSSSYNVLNTLQYNLGMAWSTCVSAEDKNVIAFGYDEGSVLIKIGSDDPVVSLSNGKIIWTKSMDVYSANLKAVDYNNTVDGQKISLNPKELGSTQIYPNYLKHSPNSHHFGLCNRKEFIVIKSASFKTVISGNGTNLVWHNDSDFAVIDNELISLYKNFQKGESMKLASAAQKLFQGFLLGITDNQKTLLYDWNDLSRPLHKLQIVAQKIWWDESNELLAIASETKLTIYQFNANNLQFSEIHVLNDKITSAIFVNKIFYFINKAGKIHLSFLGKSFFYNNAQKKQFILGALDQQERLYLFDNNNGVYSHRIPFELFNQIKLYIQGKSKNEPDIPAEFKDRVAKYYHAFDLKKEAYKLTDNQDHKFELALQLGMIRQAHKIASSTHSTPKIKLIGDLSLKKGEVQMAIQCYKKIDDLNSLLMIYSSLQLPKQLQELALRAQELTKMNIAYMCYFLTNQAEKCLEVLIKSKRFSQAALFARTYVSSRISECVSLWKKSIADATIAQKISDPNEQEQEQQQEQEQSEQNQQEKAEA